MTKSQIRTQLSAFLVVIPYYLSLRYNIPAKKDEVLTQYPVFLV